MRGSAEILHLPVGSSTTDRAADPLGPASARIRDQHEPDAARLLGPHPAAARAPASATYNSDLAFKDNHAIAGPRSGFRIIDITDPANPTQVYNTGCRHTSARATWSSTATSSCARGTPRRPAPTAGATCSPSAGSGFEGIHILDISNPADPSVHPRAALGRQRHGRGAAADQAAARTPRPPCRTTRAATSTSTSAARAATAMASTSSGSAWRIRPTRSPPRTVRRTARAPARPATTTTCS